MNLPVDHLVYAVPDLAGAIADIETLFGCDVEPGGRHANWGTRNALVRLGEARYLEIIGPDLESDNDADPVLFGLDALEAPKLVTWASKETDLEAMTERASRGGIDLGGIFPGSRQLPDGSELSWRLTDPFAERMGGIVPFLIDWGNSGHPASTLPRSCELVDLGVSHPDPGRAAAALEAIGIHLDVAGGDGGLVATIHTPNGTVALS